MEFFTNAIDYFTGMANSIWDGFLSLINNMQMIIDYGNNIMDTCYELVATLPVPLQAYATITLVFAITFQLMHMTQGGMKSDG